MNVLAGSRAAEPSGPDCELGWTSCTRRTEWNAWSTRDAKSAKARSGTLNRAGCSGSTCSRERSLLSTRDRGLTRTGRLVVAIGLGIYLFDLGTEALSLLVSLDDEPKTNRVNDGKVGPDGAFWIGTMDDRPVKEAVAALYRVTADGTVERKIAPGL